MLTDRIDTSTCSLSTTKQIYFAIYIHFHFRTSNYTPNNFENISTPFTNFSLKIYLAIFQLLNASEIIHKDIHKDSKFHVVATIYTKLNNPLRPTFMLNLSSTKKMFNYFHREILKAFSTTSNINSQ